MVSNFSSHSRQQREKMCFLKCLTNALKCEHHVRSRLNKEHLFTGLAVDNRINNPDLLEEATPLAKYATRYNNK